MSGREAGSGERQAGDRAFAAGGQLEQPMSRSIQFVELRHRTGKKRVPLSGHSIVKNQAKLEATCATIATASALGKTDPGVLAMNDPWTEHDREHVITGGTKGAVSCCGV